MLAKSLPLLSRAGSVLPRRLPLQARGFSGAAAGLSFNLTDEQKAYRDLARKFAQEKMIPAAAEYDQSMAFPEEIFVEAWNLGLVNTHIPQELGGLGLHCLDNCIIMEELAYACTGKLILVLCSLADL